MEVDLEHESPRQTPSHEDREQADVAWLPADFAEAEPSPVPVWSPDGDDETGSCDFPTQADLEPRCTPSQEDWEQADVAWFPADLSEA